MKIKSYVEFCIFNSKWILVFFYFKLFITFIIFLYQFITQHHISNTQIIKILEEVDVIMIANLIKMIITGSYHSFVSRSYDHDTEHASSGILKIKMATSMIGVATIQLLQTFLNADTASVKTVSIQLVILLFFILASISLAGIDYLHVMAENHEKQEKNEKL